MKNKTATEIILEHNTEISVLKAKYLYELFGDCVIETPKGLTIKPALLFSKLSKIMF